MTLPFTDDYREGEMVQCQRCAKNVRVKYYDRDTVVVVSTQEQQTLALRCQYCGYVLCDSCVHPADCLFPICPSCQREWGPYYFTHDAISPSSSKPALVDETPPIEKPQPKAHAPAPEAPPPPIESLGAGETDLYGEYKEWEHKKGLRKILTLVLTLLFAGLIFIFIIGPGKPLVNKGLKLLNTRPTRAPTAVVLLINTSTSEVKSSTQTILSTQGLSVTPVKPSSITIVPTETKLAAQRIVTPTPTRTKTATASLTASATLNLTSTATNPASPDCIPALSVTLNDVGKELCVTGTVVFTLQNSTAFSIFFSNEDGFFRVVLYDRVPKDIKKGVCIRVTGEIKTLTGIPVMALGYNDVIEICSP